MKATLLLLVLFVPVIGQTYKDGDVITNWTLMGESDVARLYFAPESVRRNEDIIKVWIRVDFPAGTDAAGGDLRAGKDFGSIRGYGVFNCADLAAMTGPALVLYYDRQGKLVKRQKEGERVRANEPNGLTAIFEYFCERVEVPPSGPPKLKPRS